jgi:hypothetical protein
VEEGSAEEVFSRTGGHVTRKNIQRIQDKGVGSAIRLVGLRQLSG